MADSRSKYLIKNTLVFTLGNIGSKMISFFLVPIYTNALDRTQYGVVDLVTTISMVMAPMITLNIAESVMRFGLDKEPQREKNIQIGSFILLCAMLIGIVIIPICNFFPMIASYSVYIYFYLFSMATSQIFLCDLRGKELLLPYAIGNILHTLLITGLNIVFLLSIKMEINGYFLAYIFANSIVSFYAIIVGKTYRSFKFKGIAWDKMKRMISYSVVLIPNTFMWWIMNSSDRVMVTAMISADANGVYAVSYKLPTLVATLSGIFNQAWSYSAIREAGANDEMEYNNNTFKTMISFSMLLGIGLLTIIKPFMRIYVTEDFYVAWLYMPFLIVGNVYLTLGTFMSTSYTVHKDSLGFLYSATFGAIFNIVFNMILIPYIGIYGAAIATCLSYILVFIFRLIHTRKYMVYNIKNREFIMGSIILLLSATFIYLDNIIGQIVQLILLVVSMAFYYPVWKGFIVAIAKNVKSFLKGQVK